MAYIDPINWLAANADIATGAGGLSAGVLAVLAFQAVSKKRNGNRGLTEDQSRMFIEMNMTLKQILAEMRTMNGRK